MGVIGNVFHTNDIDAAVEKGKRFFPHEAGYSYTQESVGLDPGFGSSNFGVCEHQIAEAINDVLKTLKAQRREAVEVMFHPLLRILNRQGITLETLFINIRLCRLTVASRWLVMFLDIVIL